MPKYPAEMFRINISALDVEDLIQSCFSKLCDNVRNKPTSPGS